jgi:hypothetical protein
MKRSPAGRCPWCGVIVDDLPGHTYGDRLGCPGTAAVRREDPRLGTRV